MNVIFNNNNGIQTVDIQGVTSNSKYQILNNTFWTDNGGNRQKVMLLPYEDVPVGLDNQVEEASLNILS